MTGTSNTCNNPADNNNCDSFKPVEIIVLMIFAVTAIICLDMLFYASTLEDAYITFRYSKHFSEGYGLGAWNIHGERVEGYTSFLWMVLLSAANTVRIDIRTAAKFLGMFSHLVLCSALIGFPLLRRNPDRFRNDILENPNESVLAGVFLALYLPLIWYATSGMETVLFSALTGLVFLSVFLRQSRLLLPILSILLILTRPEGLIIAGAAISLDFLIRRREGRRLLGAYISTIVMLLSVGFIIIHRLILFGDIVPNTYWAKAGGASLHHIFWGARYVYEWITNHSIIFFLCVFGAMNAAFSLTKKSIWNWPLGLGIVIGLLLAFIGYIIKVGGDNYYAFPYWRHFVQLSAPIAFLTCYTITRLSPKSRYFQLIILLIVVSLTNMSILLFNNGMMLRSILVSMRTFPSLAHAGHNDYLTKLKHLCRNDTIVASSLGGELPYVIDAVHIDILGLNTRYIAKYGSFDPKGPQDSKTDMKWVLEQHPDFIEGYFSGLKLLDSAPNEMKQYIENDSRFKMHKELLASPIFQKEYLFIRNWPYHEMDRVLFIKRSYWESRHLQNELDCIPITDTSLGIIGKSLK